VKGFFSIRYCGEKQSRQQYRGRVKKGFIIVIAFPVLPTVGIDICVILPLFNCSTWYMCCHQVHSLATVIAMKMEIPDGAWEEDPDGIALADVINRHLPYDIRIFSILPVNKYECISIFQTSGNLLA
jgi:hypothetical protein